MITTLLNSAYSRIATPVLVEIGDSLILDVSMDEVHTMNSRVTQYPVEDGSTVSDHILLEPERITIKGCVTNNPIVDTSATEGFFSLPGIVDRVASTFDMLERIRYDRVPIDIVTGLKKYSNMVLTSCSIPRNSSIGDAIQINMEFVNVRIVESKTVPSDKLNDMFQVKTHAASKNVKGNTTTTTVTDENGKGGASIAHKLAKGGLGIAKKVLGVGTLQVTQ